MADSTRLLDKLDLIDERLNQIENYIKKAKEETSISGVIVHDIKSNLLYVSFPDDEKVVAITPQDMYFLGLRIIGIDWQDT